ncbi:glycosyltransferase [candidate division KSB1 bacterium]|nr:glycosyltransferase [candidate division KSB1 bacterium]MBL7093927.1 glycosyltransferase [candidate division KSB1 bacterium]
MLTLIIFLFTFLTLIYAYKILYFYFGLFKIKQGKNSDKQPVTILVPARNEEENIKFCLDSLIQQNYPKEKLRIIVIDDDSTDRTGEIVRGYFDKHKYVQMIHLEKCPPNISPKKRALQAGIDAAEGEIIFTIDADCWAEPDWLNTIINEFSEKVGMVTGYVLFNKELEKTLFHKIQSLEFLGLTTAGIGSIGAGDPIIANGANLAFRRRTFFDAQGYQNENHIISGDDDLLLQNINQKTNWQITASTNPQTFIKTKPVSNLNDFFNQRIRWASKGLIYKKMSLVFFLVSVYIYYLLLFISLPFALWFPLYFPYPLYAFGIKLIVDFLLILKATSLVGRKDLRKYFLLTEILQLPYIIYVGFAGIMGAFSWKGR